MKNTTKRILSIICAAMMVLSLAVVPAAATTDKALFLSPDADSAPWDWTGLKNGNIVAATAVTEYTVSTKINFANYTANGSGFGRPVVIWFGGSAGLGLNPQASGQIKLYDTTTSNWGGAAAPAGDTQLATISGDDWVEISARVYTDAGATKIDWTIGETTTTVAGRKAIAGGTANDYGYFYFMVDPGICATTGTWVADWDLGIDYVNATFTTASGDVELNDDMNDIDPSAGYPYAATNGGIWNTRMNSTTRVLFTVADDPTYVPAADKYLSFSPGTGSGNWDWAGIKHGNITAATTGTEYTLSTRINLSNYAGNGRPVALQMGGNAILGMAVLPSGKVDVYNTHTTDWGGTAAPATATKLTSIDQETWYDISVRAYLDGGAVKLDWTIGEETFTGVAALKNATAIVPGNANDYGYFFLVVDPGICATTGNWVADWDLGIDNVSMTIGDVTVGGEFASVVTDPATIVGAVDAGDGMIINARMNSIGSAGRFAVTVYEDVASEEGGEDDWVEPAIDKLLKFTKDTTHGSWGGVSLLTNKNIDTNATVSEYTTSFKFKVENATAGAHAGRPFGFVVDGAGKDIFSISARSDGKVYIYMSDSMDWGGTVPIPSKCAHYTADAIGTYNQGAWIDAAVRTYKTASGIRYDVTINGEAVLTGYEGSTTLTDPMPNKMGGYFAYTPGMAWNTHLFDLTFDYIKVEYENSPAWMINEFKDAAVDTTENAFAAPTFRNDNKWVWGANNVYTTTVLDDLDGVNFTAALSADANAFVQEAGEAAPHTAAADVAVPAADEAMKVYAFAKAGYKVVGYKVDGGELQSIVANDANLYTVPVTADCAVQFVTEAIGATTPAVAKKAADAAGDKYINFNLAPAGGGSWWQSTIRSADLAYGTEFDRYVLEYRFFVDNLEAGSLSKDKYILLNMGNNRLGVLPEQDAGKLHIYLADGTSPEVVGANDVYVATVNEGDWVDVKLVVYKDGAKVLTDITVNGNTKTGLDVNKLSGGAYMYANPTPQVQENAGHGAYILQIEGISAAGDYARYYDLGVDYLNLYAGDVAIEWDFEDAYMSGNQILWTGGSQGSNNFGAFTHSVVADTDVVNTALAAGYAAAVRDEFGGVSVIAKATGATEFGIIISPEIIETLTVADLANYYVTNTATDSDIYAFKAYAQGTDGRFGVKVLGSAADATYFVGRTTPLYVYVYAVNGDAVDFAAVNANGFLFN